MSATSKDPEREVLRNNQMLLDAIVASDYQKYNELCSDDITCIEPESNNQVVAGKSFHKYYFDLPKPSLPVTVSMCNPHVRLLANNSVAIVTYIRLNQVLGVDGKPLTTQASETRVWEDKQRDGNWIHTHFHKS